MRTTLGRFLQYLRVERNASDLTIKSYREDLTALADYLSEAGGDVCPAPDRVTVSTCADTSARCTTPATPAARSPVAWPPCGASSSSASAKVGARRIRPSRCETPRKPRNLPHFLSPEDIGRLLGARRPIRRWACAIGRSWKRSTRPASA